jgi:hypothetical protein
MPPRLVENDVELQCLHALRLRQYQPERLHAGTFKTLDGRRFVKMHEVGTPDYVVAHAIYPAFYMEVKRPGKSKTGEQERRHLELAIDRLAVVTVDRYESLLAWLAQHEQRSRELWREHLEERSVKNAIDPPRYCDQ